VDKRWTRAVFGVVTAAIVLLVPAAASAHVTVNPSEAPKGGFSKLSFRVPNEKDDASTTQVEVNFPEDAPIAFVSVRPVPGWEASVETTPLETPVEAEGTEITEAVSKITWSGGEIAPGQFQEFDVSAGPLPEDADSLMFPSLQTYSDGDVVRWIEETPEGGEEPEFPAPVLTLVEGSGDEHGAETATTVADDGGDEGDDGSAAAATDDGDGDGDDDGTDALTIVALIVGIVGVLLGGAALVRSRTT
jgi:uncharacterized protein YcnI